MRKNHLYKFLRTNLKSNNGENRDWEIGEWRKEENIDICSKGFHASKNPVHALSYVKGEILALVEVRGESIIKDDKQCWSEMRIVKAYQWEKEDFVAFAIFAAEQAIDIYEKQYPKDDRPRKAIEAAREWLKNPTKKNEDVATDAANATNATYVANAARAADAAADAAYAANGNVSWKKLGDWMEERIKTLKPYKK